MPGVTCNRRRFRLTIAYDGAGFDGWQVQPGRITVQGSLEQTLEGIVKHPCKVHGSGRTDQGVHALGQVAHVDLATRMTPAALERALNTRLPRAVRILEARRAAADFHARRCATSKEYRYFVSTEKVLLPHKRLYILHHPPPLALGPMRGAARHFLGKHDFKAFMANPGRILDSSERTIRRFAISREGDNFVFAVRGDGFLYRQVRSMVGLLLRIGAGAEPPEAVAEILAAAEPRTARVPTAPPQGLFLWRVWY